MIDRCLRRLCAFRRDENGIVLILFTLMFVPILLIVAVAIDYSQVLVIKRQLTGAVDAAALTVAQMPELDDTEARSKAESFIRAHYPDAAIGALKSFAVVRGNGAVDVTATAEMPTSFLKVAGQETLEVTVNSRAMMLQSKLEVVMVLDNTGSMDSGATRWSTTKKIDDLKAAANTLVDILMGNSAESPYVKVGLVPFANAVNIGTSWRGTAIMDETAPTALNTEQVTASTGYTSLFQAFDALKTRFPSAGWGWGGCVRARGGGNDLTDTAPGSGATLFTPFFAPDEFDGSNWNRYTNSYLNDPQNAGKYKSYSFYKNAPTSSGDGSGPNYNCPSTPIQPLTNVKATITTALGKMTAKGNTVIPEGLAWGWRLISPGAPYTQGVAYDDKDTIKAIILLTDGKNDVSGGGNGDYHSVFNAYGYADNGRLGATDGSAAEATLNTKLTSLCTTIKANKDDDATDQDIVLYTIGFGIEANSNIDTIMRGCASEPSKYFNAPTTQDLQGAFESIALGLSKLRLAR